MQLPFGYGFKRWLTRGSDVSIFTSVSEFHVTMKQVLAR